MSLLDRLLGRSGEEAATPKEQPSPHPPPGGGGRTPYPGYDVMAPDKWAHDWDPKTRRVVLDRLRDVPARQFFDPAAYATLEAICARLLPQDDRPPELRIPIAPFIDQRLQEGGGNGYRYEDMPWDDVAYRRGLAGIDETTQALFGGSASWSWRTSNRMWRSRRSKTASHPAQPGASCRRGASSVSCCRM